MDKNLLLTSSRLPEDDVEIAGVGTVRVRGLNRMEVFLITKIDDPVVQDRRIVAYGMVDPKLTEAEVQRWQEVSAGGEIEIVSRAIYRLSGLLDGASQEVHKSVSGEPDAGVRVLPVPEVVYDGVAAPGTDEQ